MRVDEFGLGYPPKVKKLFTWKGTEFSLNWLPFGGFVRLYGEERDENATSFDPIKAKASDKFYDKPAWQRVIVLLAGAFINLVFGMLAFSALFTIQGIPELRELENGIMISGISPDSPAAESGLQIGDVVRQISTGEQVITVSDADTFIETIKSQAGSSLIFSGDRDLINGGTEQFSATVYVRTQEEIPANQGSIGVEISNQIIEFVKYPIWQRPFRGMATGFESSINFSFLIVKGLGDMFGKIFSSGQVPTDVAGPIGIVHMAHTQNILSQGIISILNFAAILSINLAVVNVLPIPALDGGRVVFILFEKILGKNFKPVYEQYANALGFFVLISLIVLISVKDVGTIFTSVGWTWSRLFGG